MKPVSYDDLTADARDEPSSSIRSRVERSRTHQQSRFEAYEGVHCHAEMTPALLEEHCAPDKPAQQLLKRCIDVLGMSARGYSRILKGNLSAFLRTTHMLIGKAVNAFRGRREAFWRQGRPSCVRLMTPEDILEAMVYCATNAVKEALVVTAEDWPGWVTLPRHLLGHLYETERRGRFFNKRGALGAMTAFRLTRPPGFDDVSDEAFAALFKERVAARERELTAARGDNPVMGAEAILAKKWHAKSKTKERWFQREPQFKCHDLELRPKVLRAYQQFVDAYQRARTAFERGARSTTFPHGTYLMRVRLGVRCRDPDPSCPLAKS